MSLKPKGGGTSYNSWAALSKSMRNSQSWSNCAYFSLKNSYDSVLTQRWESFMLSENPSITTAMNMFVITRAMSTIMLSQYGIAPGCPQPAQLPLGTWPHLVVTCNCC